MKRWIRPVLVTAVLAIGFCPVGSAKEFDYDIAIRGGTLYLGGFSMAGIGDVAVKGDRIVAVGQAPGKARHEINARGMIVSSGFIDLHTHCDTPFQMTRGIPLPESFKANLNYITQGVTTVVTGNCGSGFTGPAEISAWLDRVDKMPFGTNVIHLFPHGDLRLRVMGKGQASRPDPAPTPEELRKMKEILNEGLRAGAWGMSTGLEYDPGARADLEELMELNQVVASHAGIYCSHLRHEGPDPDQMIAAIEEAIAIGERAGTPVQISHIKCSGKQVHGMSQRVIEVIEAARARGVQVFADQYPYPAGSTTLSYLVPVDKRDGAKVLAQYCTPQGRASIYDEVANTLKNEIPPEGALISLYPWKWWLQGKTIAEIAKKRGEDPVEVAMDLACGRIGTGIYFTMSENDLTHFMSQDWVATGSDGATFSKLLAYAHPRFYGTFPRKLRRYVYGQQVISLPFALRSMTELPAQIFEIPDRGQLEPGYFADIVVFNPDTIRDLATFEKPCQFSQGIEYLLVNGILTIERGKYTGQRGGRSLRHQVTSEKF